MESIDFMRRFFYNFTTKQYYLQAFSIYMRKKFRLWDDYLT